MWIRSADKRQLVNAQAVWISLADGTLLMAEHAPGPEEDLDWTIGKFSTPEAALTELDAISRCIENGCKGVYQVKEDKP